MSRHGILTCLIHTLYSFVGAGFYNADDSNWACEDDDDFLPLDNTTEQEFLANLSWQEVPSEVVKPCAS